jgi:hypothetical protein
LSTMCNDPNGVYLLSLHKSVLSTMLDPIHVTVGQRYIRYAKPDGKWSETDDTIPSTVLILVCCHDGYAKDNNPTFEKQHRIDPGLSPQTMRSLDKIIDDPVKRIFARDLTVYVCASYLFRAQLTVLYLLKQLKPEHPVCTRLYHEFKTINYDRYHFIVASVARLFDTHNIRGDVMLLAYRNNVEKKNQRVTDWDCIQLVRVRAREFSKEWDDQVEQLIHRWNNDYLPRVTTLLDSDISILSSLVYKYTALTKSEEKTARALTAPNMRADGSSMFMQKLLRKRLHPSTDDTMASAYMLHEITRLQNDTEDTGVTMVQFICTKEKIIETCLPKPSTDCKDVTEEALVHIMNPLSCPRSRTYRQTVDAFRCEYLYQKDKADQKLQKLRFKWWGDAVYK